MSENHKDEQTVVQVAGRSAILIFDLNEEQSAYDCAYHGLDWALVAFALDQYLRGLLKYGHTFTDVDEALEAVRDQLRSLCDEHHVTLEMIG